MLLPPRPDIKIPSGDDVEEVDLQEYDPNERRGDGARGEAYEDEEMHLGPGLQCAHQWEQPVQLGINHVKQQLINSYYCMYILLIFIHDILLVKSSLWHL